MHLLMSEILVRSKCTDQKETNDMYLPMIVVKTPDCLLFLQKLSEGNL